MEPEPQAASHKTKAGITAVPVGVWLIVSDQFYRAFALFSAMAARISVLKAFSFIISPS
jgi:hypothetical protein